MFFFSKYVDFTNVDDNYYIIIEDYWNIIDHVFLIQRYT